MHIRYNILLHFFEPTCLCDLSWRQRRHQIFGSAYCVVKVKVILGLAVFFQFQLDTMRVCYLVSKLCCITTSLKQKPHVSNHDIVDNDMWKTSTSNFSPVLFTCTQTHMHARVAALISAGVWERHCCHWLTTGCEHTSGRSGQLAL